MIGRWPLHPILLSFFPILSLYQVNRQYVSPSDLVWPLAIAGACAGLAWALLAAATRDSRRSGQTVSVLVGLFFGLGLGPRVVQVGIDWLSALWVNADHRVPPLVVEISLAVSAAWLIAGIWRSPGDPKTRDGSLNLAGGMLVALPAGAALLAEFGAAGDPSFRPETLFPPAAARGESRPDIYYVILDGYARADVLRDLFELDNTPFLDALKSRGFSVADRSTSNYCQTPLSLASSLNARYLGEADAGPSGDREPLHQRIARNSVARTLRGLGYASVAFDSGFDMTDCKSFVDDYRAMRARPSAFHEYLIDASPLRLLRTPLKLGQPFEMARERVGFSLAGLARLAADPRPTFAFAHLLIPHPPFLFRPDGGPRERPGQPYTLLDGDAFHRDHGDDQEYISGYRDQVNYINDRLIEMIDAIRAASPEPPVIILQSDHGSGLRYATYSLERTDLRERFGNLIAIGWPGDGAPPGFRDDLSAVNVFRVVLDGLFGAGPPQLPDRCFYSYHDDPYRYTDVTELARDAGGAAAAASNEPGKMDR